MPLERQFEHGCSRLHRSLRVRQKTQDTGGCWRERRGRVSPVELLPPLSRRRLTAEEDASGSVVLASAVRASCGIAMVLGSRARRDGLGVCQPLAAPSSAKFDGELVQTSYEAGWRARHSLLRHNFPVMPHALDQYLRERKNDAVWLAIRWGRRNSHGFPESPRANDACWRLAVGEDTFESVVLAGTVRRPCLSAMIFRP
jgi:hypothetical protein